MHEYTGAKDGMRCSEPQGDREAHPLIDEAPKEEAP
jgi:hypothetical protein